MIKPSLYCKDELPTWDEINRFLQTNLYHFDPNNPNHLKMDPYWKRPYQKMILMWLCNQLNKLVYDQDLNTTEGIQFILMQESIPILGLFPNIYSCKIPSTGDFSIFITDGYPRIDIDDITKRFSLTLMVNGIPQPEDHTIGMVYKLLKDVIEYYKKPIGWKDEDGNLIPISDSKRTCAGVGIDPAL